MSTFKRRLTDRLLAGLLAVLMTVTMLPSTAATALAADRAVTVSVKDSNGKALSGAAVTISYNGESLASGKTGNGGSVRLTISDYNARYTYQAEAKLDGYEPQTLNFNGSTSVEIKLNLETFQFKERALEIPYGKTATNVASSGSGSRADGYSSQNTKIATVNNTGEVTPKGIGSTTINAIKNNNIVASYQLTVTKGNQAELTWNVPLPNSITWKTRVDCSVKGGSGNGEVTYSSNSKYAIVSKTGSVSFTAPGKYSITAHKDGDTLYEETSIERTITVGKADWEVSFKHGTTNIPSLAYGKTYQNVAAVTGEAGAKISYSSSDTKVATVDSNGVVTAVNLGTATITATVEGDDWYNQTRVSYKITVGKADQEITFKNGDAPTVTFNDNNNEFSNPASTNITEDGITVSYSYEESREGIVSEFNTATGDFIIAGAGTITVTATTSGNGHYNSAQASYVLTVNKAKQKIAFPDESKDFVIFLEDNKEKYSIFAAAEKGDYFGTGEITYSVKAEPENVIANFNEETKEIVVASDSSITPNSNGVIGRVTVEATKAEDDNYHSAKAEYTFEIRCVLGSSEEYYVVGTKSNPNNDWYTSDVVTIYPAEGHSLHTGWWPGSPTVESIPIDRDGDNIQVTLWVTSNSVEWEWPHQIEVLIKKDSQPPFNLKIDSDAGISAWDKKLSIIPHEDGSAQDKLAFIIYADDALPGSTIDFNGGGYQYFIDYCDDNNSMEVKSMEEIKAITKWINAPWGNFSVEKDKKFIAYVKVQDVAGNCIYGTTNGVIFDMSAPDLKVELDKQPAGERQEFYVGDITLDVTAGDGLSGIKSITYQVTSNGKVTQSDTLFDAGLDYDTLTHDDLTFEWKSKIVVDAEKNSSDDVKVVITVTNNAGNSTTFEKTMKILAKAPELTVTMSGDKKNVLGDVHYYDSARTATITIKGRTSAFDESRAIITVNEEGASNNGDLTYSISKWETTESKDKIPDEATHTATITFNGSAKYSFTVDYTDLADQAVKQHQSETFVVDTEDPTGTIKMESIDGSMNAESWKKLASTRYFNLWRKTGVKVSAEVRDNISPIKSVQYYVAEGESAKEALTEKALQALDPTAWQDYSAPLSFNEDKQFVVYLKVTDYAERTTYLSTDGIIVDMQKPGIALEYDAANAYGYYNQDLTINVTVTDPDPYSGIQSVEYWIVTDGKTTKKEFLYQAKLEGNVGHEKLVSELNTLSFTIDAKKNNSDDVKVYVKAVDNAGNEITYAEDGLGYVPMKFSTTLPKINVTFDNKEPNVVVNNRAYFTRQTARIFVTNRTTVLNEDNLLKGIVVTGRDSAGNEIELTEVDVVKSYAGVTERGTPDEAIHEFVVEFKTDANYDFSLSYTDKADNSCEYKDVKFDGKPRQDTDQYFTVDDTPPTTQVTVDGYTWTKLLENLTFGLWNGKEVTVEAEAWDATSPVTIEYYKTDKTTAMTRDELNKVKGWKEFEPFDVNLDERFVIYLKVTDYAGNYVYASSDGYIVDMKPVQDDNLKITLEETDVTLEGVGVYKDDVTVQIEVSEIDLSLEGDEKQKAIEEVPYAGIQKVEYWVVTNEGTPQEKETQRESLYLFDYVRDEGETDESGLGIGKNTNTGKVTITEIFYGEDGTGEERTEVLEGNVPLHEHLRHSFAKEITIDSEKNNCSSVTLHVGVTDNAGNYYEKTAVMDIDVTAPTIEVTYDNNEVNKMDGERGYLPDVRTATIVITERSNHFSETDANDRILIVAKDARGEDVEIDRDAMSNNWLWETTEAFDEDGNPNPDGDVHVLTIKYDVDANYTFEITYEDLAGNQNEDVQIGEGTKAPFEFTVDRVEPTSEITAENVETQYKETWDDLIGDLTFGIWKQEKVSITAVWDDVISPIDSVCYYKTGDTVAKTRADLEALDAEEWIDFQAFDVEPNEQFTVYLRIVDYAGNTKYVSTNGIIVDNVAPDIDSLSPGVNVSVNGSGIFNRDVTVSVSVTDPLVGNAYSGIREIIYEVYNSGTKTQEGMLYSFEEEQPLQEQLLQAWSSANAFTVNSTLNNSNNVEIRVRATDNAGNISSKSEFIKIDVTKPSISVTYDNNDGDVIFGGEATGAFFRDVRTATIVITERNFDPSQVTVHVTNTDGVIPTLSGWSSSGAGGNGDGTTHTATITYAADGDYTFEVSCTDMAGNANEEVNYGNSLAPQKFTIDRTLPVITITYDNNDARNGNYYKAMRTATVTIDEHNFETSRIKIALTATNDGAAIALPAVSGWTSYGDRHVAVIAFKDDALYSFDVDYEDKAGNASADMEPHVFYVDTTVPVLKIENVTDESANSQPGNIGFVITATDVNFDEFEPVITATIRNGKDFVTKKLEVGAYADVKNGKTFTVTNLDEDGIYRIECHLVDKAGNAYDQVILTRKGGAEYAERRAEGDALITFSVNRNGSTFEVDEKTQAVLDRFYLRNVEDDVVFYEVNADPLKEFGVTLNGRVLEQGKDYRVEESGGNGKWYRYTYVIDKRLFEGEGEYVIVSSSRDKAENDAFSDVKGASIRFVVDRTPPVVTVTGLSDSGRYQTENQTVTIVPTDDGGALKSLTVSLVGNDGAVIRDLLKLEGEALLAALESGNGMLTFQVPEGLYQNIKIVAKDQAGEGEESNTFDQTIRNVSVTSSGFLIFWANRPLRWGVIGGFGAFLFLLILLIVRKKKKEQR